MNWPVVPLGEIACSIRNGIFSRRPSDDPAGGSRILRISAVRDGRVNLGDTRFVTGLEPNRVKQFSISQGDLLVTRYNGSRHLVGTSGIVPPHDGHVIHPDKLIRVVIDCDLADPRFVNYQFQSPQVRAHLEPRIRTTAGQSGLAGADIRSVPIVLPPLDQQWHIVDFLEDRLSRLEAAVQSLSTALTRSEVLLTAGLWRATHGLEGSKTTQLQSVAEVRLGRQRSPKNHTGDRMRPYLRAANVDWNRLRLDDVKEMQFSGSEEEVYRLEVGDILLTEASGSAAEVGKSAVYRGEPPNVCFQNTLLRVRCHEADPDFVHSYLLAEARAGQFLPESRGVGINHLGRQRLANLPIRMPPPDIQRAAARTCRELVEQVGRLRATVCQQVDAADALRRSVLAAAFSRRLTKPSSGSSPQES